jgi:hypothetical protein
MRTANTDIHVRRHVLRDTASISFPSPHWPSEPITIRPAPTSSAISNNTAPNNVRFHQSGLYCDSGSVGFGLGGNEASNSIGARR